MRSTYVLHERTLVVLLAVFTLMEGLCVPVDVLPIGRPLDPRRPLLTNASSREDHERHCCALVLSCPLKCELCNSFCSAGDHFHALQDYAVHLCGWVQTKHLKISAPNFHASRQQHACPYSCQLMGICQVDTTPQSIESTFVGRHERFQYTKVMRSSS